jgi:protein-disulfide isomerase
MRTRIARIALVAAVAAFTAVTLSAQSAAGSVSVATLNGKPITDAEVEKFLGSRLLRAKQQEYDLKSEGIRELAFGLLQDQEAARLGITRDTLYRRNVTDKAGEPSEGEVTALLNRVRSRLPGDDAQARQEVVKFLREQRRLEREAAYREELFAKASLKVLLEPPRAAIPIEADDPFSGRADAPVTVVEFTDFQCPFCKNTNAMLKQLRSDYGDRLRVVYKQLPLGMHAQARGAAEAALCANDQGKYGELRDWMFNNPNLLKTAALVEQAGVLGMKADRFRQCLDGQTKAAAVDADVKLAEELGASGTPTYFVNGRLMEGARSVEDFKRVIDEELARPAASKSATR